MEPQKQTKQEDKTINTILNGYQVSLSLFQYENQEKVKQNGLMINIRDSKAGKRYQGMLKYQQQNQAFKFIFGSMNQVIYFIQNSLEKKDDMVRVTQTGKLQIGTKQNKKTKYLTLQTEIVQIKEKDKDIEEQKQKQQLINFQIKKDMIDIQNIINDLKKQILHMKDQLNKKVSHDQNLAILQDFQNGLQDKLKENQKKTNNIINDIQKTLKINQDGLLAIRLQIQNSEKLQKEMNKINKIIGQLKLNYQASLEKQKQQMKPMVIQKFYKQQNKDIGIIFSLQNLQKYKFDQLGIKKVLLTVNAQIGQFKLGYFRMANNKIFQRCKDSSCWRQVVSRQQLPSTGKYFFQVNCHQSIDNATFVGILTQNCLQNQDSSKSQQSMSYGCFTGCLYQNGTNSGQLGRKLNNKKGLVSVLVDMQNKQIHWSIDHQYQGVAKINQNLLNKRLYAFIDVYYGGSLHEFIS